MNAPTEKMDESYKRKSEGKTQDITISLLFDSIKQQFNRHNFISGTHRASTVITGCLCAGVHVVGKEVLKRGSGKAPGYL